ncbi:hypothetical protein HRI_002007500 [Hibiscus trionum]|uniref:Uncharacterized protein n=1 Tax=Hibiscus trionum TaxID=183268 RepID=A0A9W7HUU8_HIBTR|nr:hypothetical protein HRI_002007500 [Hibiscus trionum]
MSTTLLFLFLLYFFLLLSPPSRLTGPSSGAIVAGAVRPLVSKDQDLVTFDPKTGMKHGFHEQDVKGCLPKGFHRTSAPSRYINGHTFGSTLCSTTSDVSTKP